MYTCINPNLPQHIGFLFHPSLLCIETQPGNMRKSRYFWPINFGDIFVYIYWNIELRHHLRSFCDDVMSTGPTSKHHFAIVLYVLHVCNVTLFYFYVSKQLELTRRPLENNEATRQPSLGRYGNVYIRSFQVGVSYIIKLEAVLLVIRWPTLLFSLTVSQTL